MGEFKRVFEVFNAQEFATARLAKLRLIGSRPGGDRFLAMQHAFFLLAHQRCRCGSHQCKGCEVTLTVARGLEQDLEHIDPRIVSYEEGKAVAIWDRKEKEERDDLIAITLRWVAIDAAKKARHAPREASIQAAQLESGDRG